MARRGLVHGVLPAGRHPPDGHQLRLLPGEAGPPGDVRKRTNVWCAKTDDDSGNSGVYISAVYLKGGANDQPVPGLRTC
ncbi:hypothetical protein [Streptomyces sp. NPDC058773]|uniref:hypothetical protein n=1 Tax=Streptomyces sp. NPDC058773 TaxID=3346632 RepID=UPI0036B40DDA